MADSPGPVLYDKAAVRWFAKYAADGRYLLLRDACELIDLLDGVDRHDQVAVVRLERWLCARGCDDEADRVAQMAAAYVGFRHTVRIAAMSWATSTAATSHSTTRRVGCLQESERPPRG